MPTDYVSLAVLKSSGYLDISDTDDDASLQSCITAASRQVEFDTGRRFYAASETRYFDVDDPGRVWVGDLLSVTTLATDSSLDRTYATTWAATDYELWPHNAALNNRPYRAITVHPTGSYTFLTGSKTVKIVGSFGYCAAADCPAGIVQAVCLFAARLHKRHKAIFGVSGTPEYGSLMAVVPTLAKDPDYQTLIAPFVPADRWSP